MKLAVLLLALVPVAAWAQGPTTSAPARHATVFDLTGAYGRVGGYIIAESRGRWYASAAGWHVWGIDATGRFQVGVGGRITHFRSETGDYLLTGRTPSSYSPVSMGQSYVPYFVLVQAPRLTTANVALHARVRVVGPVRLGFTIDLLGLTFGSGKLYGTGYDISIRPTRLNLLLGGANDRGSLNSEFYVGADLSPHFAVRAGLSHVVNAYTATVPGETDLRYQRFSNLGLLGLSWTI